MYFAKCLKTVSHDSIIVLHPAVFRVSVDGVVNIVVNAVKVSFRNWHSSKACDFPLKCVQSGGGFVE